MSPLFSVHVHNMSCNEIRLYLPSTFGLFGTNMTLENWPLCVYVDAESCDPSTEIDIPESTGKQNIQRVS